jgi:hypothetical protein
MDNNKIQSFENKKVRSIWDAEIAHDQENIGML